RTDWCRWDLGCGWRLTVFTFLRGYTPWCLLRRALRRDWAGLCLVRRDGLGWEFRCGSCSRWRLDFWCWDWQVRCWGFTNWRKAIAPSVRCGPSRHGPRWLWSCGLRRYG